MKFCLLIGFFFLPSILSRAQSCNGSLGDPIINVTFGVGHNPLPPNITTYTYARGCPAAGEYTINNFLFGCGGSWIKMTGDHTGDVDGNYMLVNAENTPGIVHTDTVTGLCANITYQYVAFVTNVMQDVLTCNGHAILPNLTFSAQTFDGTLLASYNTGDIPITNDKVWKQYGVSFTNPAGVNSVILKITANAKNGCGNGFALDDITLRQCSPAEVIVTIDGSTEPANVCADYTNPFIMNGTFTAGFTDPVVQWQNSLDSGKTWDDIQGETTTTYQVPHRTSGVILYRMIVADRENINSPNCRIPSNTIYTSIHSLPEHKPPQYVTGCAGQDFVLPETNPSALVIEWNATNGYHSALPGSIIQNFQYADTGLYTLKETFYFGCISLDTFFVSASPGIKISVQPSYPLCEGMSENLSATSSVPGAFKWTPSAGLSSDTIPNPVARPKEYTEYKVTVANSYGCKDSALAIIDVYKNPVAQAGPDKTIIIGDSIILNGSVQGTNVNYYWSPPTSIDDIHSLQPTVFPSQEIVYSLNAISSVGCGSVSDLVKVTVYNDIYIPNSFTPNGDGKNDKFRVLLYENYKLVKLNIYNRWGKLIFETSDIYKGWDGTFGGIVQPPGVYVYYLELQNTKGKKISKRGTVLLLR